MRTLLGAARAGHKPAVQAVLERYPALVSMRNSFNCEDET